MASLFQENGRGNFKIKFRFGGTQMKFSLRHDNRIRADETLARVTRTLADLEEGRLVLPDGADVVQFVKTDGGRAERLAAPNKQIRLGEMLDLYFDTVTKGSKAASSLLTNKIHGRHLARILGTSKSLLALTAPGGIQQYIEKRNEQKYNGRSIQPRTIKKELATLQMVWRWANSNGHTTIPYPTDAARKLVYPIDSDREPFKTLGEIQQRIKRGGLTRLGEKRLWECLFLSVEQVEEVLDFAKENATTRWIYAALLFLAHTGARRSEMVRSEVGDLDFSQKVVKIRERKRRRGQLTFRHIDMSARFRTDIKDYLASQPGSRFTIAIDHELAEGGSSTSDAASEQYVKAASTRASKEFRKLFSGSKWDMLPGFHLFRHSMASSLARSGIDRRKIDGILGHETEEMSRRYLHLFPSDTKNAITKLFDC